MEAALCLPAPLAPPLPVHLEQAGEPGGGVASLPPVGLLLGAPLRRLLDGAGDGQGPPAWQPPQQLVWL